MIHPLQLLLGILFAIIVATLAYRAHSLSPSGALAATVLGSVVFGLGGLPWAVLLLGFFITSSALSRLFGKRKHGLAEKFSKGSTRDAGQVLANGGVAGIFVLLHLIFPAASWPWLAFAGSLAAVNADTWATELGVLSPLMPVNITTFRPVERGSSGGITLTGTLASLGGAALIAFLAVLVMPMPGWPLALLLISLAGLAGGLVNLLLGATLQASYYCSTCQKETERHPTHTCGSTTTQVRGLAWLDNDWVNTTCALAGALIALSAALAWL